jgi:hypothetical protein
MTHQQKRLTRLEEAQRLRYGNGHFISVLRYPWPMRDDELDGWLAEQCHGECSPECRGKTVGLLVPAEAPSMEAWEEEVQRYTREKAASYGP